MSSTKKFLKATGYATVAFLAASLAKEQNSLEVFTAFTLASGIAFAGASCSTIVGFEHLKDEKEARKRWDELNRQGRGAQPYQALPEQDAQQCGEDSNPTTPEA